MAPSTAPFGSAAWAAAAAWAADAALALVCTMAAQQLVALVLVLLLLPPYAEQIRPHAPWAIRDPPLRSILRARGPEVSDVGGDWCGSLLS